MAVWQWPLPVPEGFEIWSDGVWKFDADYHQGTYGGGDPTKPRKVGKGKKGKGLPGTRIFRSPWWVSAVGDDTASNPPVRWIKLQNDRGRSHWVTAAMLASRSSIASLANYGFGVTLSNVTEFSDLANAWVESANRHGAVAKVSSRLGTLTFEDPDEGAVTGYLTPRKWYGPGKVEHTGNVPQVLRALRSQGTLEGWLVIADKHTTTPIARWLLMTSFAPPILRTLGVRTFFLHHWGSSGAGKSALAKLAASVWGDPKAFALTFNATQRGLFEAFTDFDGLLCVVNELQIATYREHMAQIIYSTTEEGARLRSGQQGGAERRESNFRIITRTNGEQPILAESDHTTGVANRTLELRADVLSSAQASQLHRDLDATGGAFGVAGEAWVDWVLGSKDGARAVLTTHEALRGKVLEAISSVAPHAVDAPHVGMLHAVTTADALATHLLYQGPIDACMGMALERLRVIAPLILPVRESAGRLYMKAVLDHLSGARDVYDGANPEHREAMGQPNTQIAAILNPVPGEALWLTPSSLTRLCRLDGLRASRTQVVTAWHEAELLASAVPVKRRIGSRRLRVYAFTKA